MDGKNISLEQKLIDQIKKRNGRHIRPKTQKIEQFESSSDKSNVVSQNKKKSLFKERPDERVYIGQNDKVNGKSRETTALLEQIKATGKQRNQSTGDVFDKNGRPRYHKDNHGLDKQTGNEKDTGGTPSNTVKNKKVQALHPNVIRKRR